MNSSRAASPRRSARSSPDRRGLLERPARPGACSSSLTPPRRLPRALSPRAPPPSARHGRRAAPRRGAAVRTPSAQREPGQQVDDVVLAEVDEREPERGRVGPAERRRRRGPVSASTCAAVTDVAKCSDGMAARGFPPRTPYRGAQPDFQNCSPYSTIMRRSSGRAGRPSMQALAAAAYQGGAVGTAQ